MRTDARALLVAALCVTCVTSATQRGSVRYGAAQRGAASRGATQDSAAQAGVVKRDAAQESAAQRGTPRRGETQDSAAQAGVVKRDAAQESAAQQEQARALLGVSDRWRHLMSEYSRSARSTSPADWFPSAIPIHVPLPAGSDSRPRDSVTVYVVPVPVPVHAPAPPAPPAQCSLNAQHTGPAQDQQYAHKQQKVQKQQNVLEQQYVQDQQYVQEQQNVLEQQYGQDQQYVQKQQNVQKQQKVQIKQNLQKQPNKQQHQNVPEQYIVPEQYELHLSPPVDNRPTNDRLPPQNAVDTSFSLPPSSPGAPQRRVTIAPAAPTSPSSPTYEEPSTRPPARVPRDTYNFPPAADTQRLVEQFRAQLDSEPSLPPIGIDPVGAVSTDDRTEEEVRALAGLPAEPASEPRRAQCQPRPWDAGQVRAPPPPAPRFDRSLFLRARLTVPRAGFSEPYDMWWDAASGATRVDFHGGTASMYRMARRDGRVRSVLSRIDRTEESDVRRCIVSPPRSVSLAERALPALPDLQAFQFAGYVVRGVERGELWRNTLTGARGELGGARGEALTFRHDLLVRRSPDNLTTTPLWYSVRVDSSLLGANADGYVHQFEEVQVRHHDTALLHLEIADACDQVEDTNQLQQVEPLLEYTALRRDQRHDALFLQYKNELARTYANDVEEAVRKNVLVQNYRFTESGNRQGASFRLAINYLSDRLLTELSVLLGVEPPDAGPSGSLPFPLSASEVEAKRNRLPRKFDWRKRGAVTQVRNQLPCPSCWAFATVGSVEGALFVESNRLVPLSEQVLLDCAHPYGTHGCNPTWPMYAYNYIEYEGLPALHEYTPYQAKNQTCRNKNVPPVTRISGHYNVTQNNLIALKVAIKTYGPTVVLIDANLRTFYQYSGGYYHDKQCRRDSSNHAVLAVGWTMRREETHIIIKNSWGTSWGEAGYMRLRGSTNACGVLRAPTVPRLRAADVLRVPADARVAADVF